MLNVFKPLLSGRHPNQIFHSIVSLSVYHHLLHTHLKPVIFIAVILLVHLVMLFVLQNLMILILY